MPYTLNFHIIYTIYPIAYTLCTYVSYMYIYMFTYYIYV